MSVITFLGVGLLVGYLAGVLVKGGGFGLVGNLVVGVIGASLGGGIMNLLGISDWAFTMQVGIATACSVGLLYVSGRVKRLVSPEAPRKSLRRPLASASRGGGRSSVPVRK